MSGISRWTLYFLAGMGLLFALPPLLVILYKLYFRLACKKAYGRVLRIEKNPDPDGAGLLLQPVIAFHDEDGRLLEVRTGLGYGLKYLPAVNSTVKLYYRTDSQALRVQVASRGLWEISGIFILVGLLMMLPLLWVLWNSP